MGGQESSRGYLLQTLACLLEAVRTPDWDEVTIEPDVPGEKVDILWRAQGRQRAVQVKSSQNQISLAQAKQWATALRHSYQADAYELQLFGPTAGSVVDLDEHKHDGVVVRPPQPLDVQGAKEKAAHRLHAYLNEAFLPPVSPRAKLLDLLVDGLVSRLLDAATAGRSIPRRAFNELLNDWISETRESEGFVGASQQHEAALLLGHVSRADLARRLRVASAPLRDWPATLGDDVWLEREELDRIRAKISESSSSVTLVVGGPGSGKSALLSRLLSEMTDVMPALGIKADILGIDVTTAEALTKVLKLPSSIPTCLQAAKNENGALLVLDQLDVLAEIQCLTTDRLSVLLDLVERAAEIDGVHVVASCRTFERQHDHRLRGIDATVLELDPISWELIQPIVAEAGYSPDQFAPGLQQALRQPFMLKAFLDMGVSSEQASSVASAHGMLDSFYLDKLPEGEESARFLERLATEIANRESMWLPTSRYVGERLLIDQLVEAGVLHRRPDGRQFGFRHQLWYEHARARAFVANDGGLADFVLRRQSTLSVRSVLLSSLQYLRDLDEEAYVRECNGLLGSTARPHIRGLVVDFVGQVETPMDAEVGWIARELRDRERRTRALASIAGRPSWLAILQADVLPALVREQPPVPNLARVLREAGAFAPHAVCTLLEPWLADNSLAGMCAWVLMGVSDWDDRALAIARRLVTVDNVDRHVVRQLVSAVSAQHPEAAPQLVRDYLAPKVAAAISAARADDDEH
ncbi:MAG: hypothetical protein KC503_13635 [Myxococcales bacterium]|nr:hypothetical protein [Myxococcales bacterium]